MADKTISQLDEITDPNENDELLFLDSSNSNLKKVKFKDLGGNDDFDKRDYPFTILGRGSSTDSLVLNVGAISNGAFQNSGTIKGVHIGSKVTNIGTNSFKYSSRPDGLTFSEGITGIGSNAFYNCSVGGDIQFPDSLTSIGQSCFAFGSFNGSVKFGQNLTGVRNSAFAYCGFPAGATLEFPDSVTFIGGACFMYSTLQHTKIGTGIVTSSAIASAFTQNGSSLKTVEISPENTGIASLSGCVYDKDLTTLKFIPGGFGAALVLPSTCTSITSQAGYRCTTSALTMNEGLLSIGSSAFYYGSIVGPITCPDSLTGIGSTAFGRNTSITTVTVPNATIGQSAFNYCGGLKTGTLGTGVASVGNNSFGYCGSLVELNCNVPLTSIGSNAFYVPGGGSLLTINVRTGDSTWTAGSQTLRGRNVNVIKNLP